MFNSIFATRAGACSLIIATCFIMSSCVLPAETQKYITHCINDVVYIETNNGLAPMYNTDGSLELCNKQLTKSKQ